MGSKVSEMISDAIIRDTRKPQSTFIAPTDTPTFGTPPLLNTATKHQEVKDGRDSIYYSQSGKYARVFRKPKVGETANTMISDRLADSAVSNMCRSAPIKVMHVDVEAAPGCYLRGNKSVPYFTQSVPNVNTTDMRSAFVENPNNSACPNQLLTTGSPSANAPCTLSNTTTLYPGNTVNFQHSNATQTAQRTRDGNFGRFKNVQFDLCSGNITAAGSTHCEMDVCQHSTELYSLLRRKEQELHERDECIRRLKKVIRDKTQMLNDLMAKHSEMENKFETHIGHNALMKRTHDRAIREQRTIMSDIVSSDSGVAHSTPSSGAKSCPYSDVNFDPSETLIRLNRDLPSDRQGIEGQHSDVDKDGRYRSGNKFSQQRRAKRYAISGESTKDLLTPSSPSANLPKFAKPERTKKLITQAILDNDFMKHLDQWQISEIVESMCPLRCARLSWIIQEGEVGSVVYVLEDGCVEVLKAKKRIREMGPGTVFGELAILYNCTRTASVKATADCKLWAIDRHCFQSIMMHTGMRRQKDYVQFLKSVPTFSELSLEVLGKVADVLGACHYNPGDYVIREGARGDTFFIISGGKVKVTKNRGKEGTEQFIGYMQRGDWFGEKALCDEDVRTANIIAVAPDGVDCLLLDRESYNLLIKDLVSFKRTYKDERPVTSNRLVKQFADSNLKDFELVGTIGIGGFGRVHLVAWRKDKKQTFALKKLRKRFVVETRQQEHVRNERNILMETDNEFIVRLYRTFKDPCYVYFLLEACLGGELWTILRNRTAFDDGTTRFYTACVVEGISYLHQKGIVFRDLKPENLILDSIGYCKLTDFGFAKKIGFETKTWTFCGTPEYVAPEIILNKGHDFAVDLWSIGILIFELLTGTPPFNSADTMRTYNIILKGISAIEFPKSITRNAQCLIKKLCRENATERLGARKGSLAELQRHVWFEGFNWNGLLARTLIAPIVPKISSPMDLSNFDQYAEDEEPAQPDTTNWDYDF